MMTRTSVRARKRLSGLAGHRGTFGFFGHVGRAGRGFSGAPGRRLGRFGQTGFTSGETSPALQSIGFTGASGIPANQTVATTIAQNYGTGLTSGITGGVTSPALAPIGITAANAAGMTALSSPIATRSILSSLPASLITVNSVGAPALNSTGWLLIAAIGIGAVLLLTPRALSSTKAA